MSRVFAKPPVSFQSLRLLLEHVGDSRKPFEVAAREAVHSLGFKQTRRVEKALLTYIGRGAQRAYPRHPAFNDAPVTGYLGALDTLRDFELDAKRRLVVLRSAAEVVERLEKDRATATRVAARR